MRQLAYLHPTIARTTQFELLIHRCLFHNCGSMSVMKFSVCSSTFVNPFAPCALLHFFATMSSSDFQKKNASNLIFKFDFDFNIRLTFPGSPKFLTQLDCYMPRSRTPVDRYFLFQKLAYCLRAPYTVSASTLCSIYLTVLYHFKLSLCGL